MEMTYTEGYFRKQLESDFPGFDDPRLKGIRIPRRFRYTGWKNDACPSFTDKERGQKLWIDWRNPGKRESERPRFQLDIYDPETDQYEFLMWTDDWEELLGATD